MKWKSSDIFLKYDFGDITLFKKLLKGIVCTSHFLDMPEDGVCDISSSILHEYGVDAAQILSCPVVGRSKVIEFRSGLIVYCTSRYRHHYVDTSVSFDEYLRKFKSKTRSTLKKKVHKFFQDDPQRNFFRRFSAESEMEAFIVLAGAVSSKTYQHHLFSRGLPQSKEFVLEAKKKAMDGLVRGYLLYCDGKAVAYTYGPVMEGGVFLFDYNGYDPDYNKLSPGNVLQFKTIEDLCYDPEIKIYDLCVGENDHKLLFSGSCRNCADFLILKISFLNICLVLSNVSVSVFSKLVGNLLQQLNMKSWLKRFIRRNAKTRLDSQDEDSLVSIRE